MDVVSKFNRPLQKSETIVLSVFLIRNAEKRQYLLGIGEAQTPAATTAALNMLQLLVKQAHLERTETCPDHIAAEMRAAQTESGIEGGLILPGHRKI